MNHHLLSAGLGVLLAASAAIGQSVPASIVAEGVPDVPRELTRALTPYQNARAAIFQGWYADRREILILTRFADTNQVHHVAVPGGARTQWTFLNDRVIEAAPRPGRSQYVYAADEGGAENYQLVFGDPVSPMATRITQGHARNVLAGWSSSGRFLGWSSNARTGKDMDLYVMDASDPGSARRLKEVSGDWAITDWSPDDRRVVAVEWISINESYVHVIDVDTGRTEALTPRRSAGQEPVAYADVRWSKDGKALYGTTDRESEFRRLARYDLASKDLTIVSSAIPWDIESFDLADDGRTIVVSANEDGISRLHVLDTDGHERSAPKLPAGVVSHLKFRRGSREFAFNLTSARATNDAYSYDLGNDVLTRWTKSEVGGLDPEAFAEPELIRFPAFDGRKIPAFVYRPRGKFSGPRPVLIDIHGGPEGQFRPGFLGRSNYLLDELGIAIIHPNVRGSSGYGKSYLKLDNARLREDSVKDIGALLDWIAKQPNLDASRVAVIGASYGGFMTLSSLTHYSDRLKAGIDVVGISNFVSFLEHTQGYRRDLRRAEYGDERDPAMRKILEAISPLSSADKIGVPLLVAQGKNDPRVPLSESEQIVAKVRGAGKPVWYVVANNEGHGFVKKTNQDYLQAVEVLFLRRFLLGEGS
jgi:dipeptidyl aminopeptidase/acylaminoacyl peptidase